MPPPLKAAKEKKKESHRRYRFEKSAINCATGHVAKATTCMRFVQTRDPKSVPLHVQMSKRCTRAGPSPVKKEFTPPNHTKEYVAPALNGVASLFTHPTARASLVFCQHFDLPPTLSFGTPLFLKYICSFYVLFFSFQTPFFSTWPKKPQPKDMPN